MADFFRGPLIVKTWHQDPNAWWRTWTWTYNLNLIGQDRLPPGKQRWELPVIEFRDDREWAYNLTLRLPVQAPVGKQYWVTPSPEFREGRIWTQDLLPLLTDRNALFSVRIFDLPPIEQREVRAWAWSYNVNLIGQDQLPVGERSFETSRDPREFRSWVWGSNLTLSIQLLPPGLQLFETPREFREQRGWEWKYNLNLIGQDALPPGRGSQFLPTGPSWYQSWVVNLQQSTLFVVTAPVGVQEYDRPQLAPQPPTPSWTWQYNLNLIGQDQLPVGEIRTALAVPAPAPIDPTWTWKYNLNLIGRDALPIGKVTYELPPREARERRDWNINLVLTTLAGQDRMTVGERVFDLPDRGPPPIVPSWQWSYNLNLIGQDVLPVGEISTALPRGPDWLLGWTQSLLQTTLAPTFAKPLNQYDWPVPQAPLQAALGWAWQYNPNLVGQDAMLVGKQRYDLWTPEPQRQAQLSTWIWQYNLNLIGKDALPVGAKSYDQPPLRVFWQRSWELNLVLGTLQGQDKLPTGEQSWFLPPQPAQQAAQVWTWQYNPNLVGQDQLPAGARRTELPSGPDWRIGWTQSLALQLSVAAAVPVLPNLTALPTQPIYPQDLRSWLQATRLLIGQDAMLAGKQVYDRPPLGPIQPDRSFTFAGLSLITAPIVYTVGKQIYDLWLKGPEYPVDLRNGPQGLQNINLFPPPPPTPVVVVTQLVGDPYDRRKRYRFSQPFAPMDRWQYEEMLEFLARGKMSPAERRAYEVHREILLRVADDRDVEFLMLQDYTL